MLSVEANKGNVLVVTSEINSPGEAALDKFHPGQALSLLPDWLHLLFEVGTSPNRCRHNPLAAHAAKRACCIWVRNIVSWLDSGTIGV